MLWRFTSQRKGSGGKQLVLENKEEKFYLGSVAGEKFFFHTEIAGDKFSLSVDSWNTNVVLKLTKLCTFKKIKGAF